MTDAPSGRRNPPVCLACGSSRSPRPPAAEAAGKRAPGRPHSAAFFSFFQLFSLPHHRPGSIATGCHITGENGARRVGNTPSLVDTRAGTEAVPAGLARPEAVGTTRLGCRHRPAMSRDDETRESDRVRVNFLSGHEARTRPCVSAAGKDDCRTFFFCMRALKVPISIGPLVRR